MVDCAEIVPFAVVSMNPNSKQQVILDFQLSKFSRARYLRGGFSNINQSGAKKDCLLTSDWSKFGTYGGFGVLLGEQLYYWVKYTYSSTHGTT